MFKFLKDKLAEAVSKFSKDVDEQAEDVVEEIEEKKTKQPSKKQKTGSSKKEVQQLKKKSERAKEIIEENKGMRTSFVEEPIAFGLKAVIAGFDIDEAYPLDPIEESLREIENVNSAEVADMRRAFG